MGVYLGVSDGGVLVKIPIPTSNRDGIAALIDMSSSGHYAISGHPGRDEIWSGRCDGRVTLYNDSERDLRVRLQQPDSANDRVDVVGDEVIESGGRVVVQNGSGDLLAWSGGDGILIVSSTGLVTWMEV